MAAQNLKSFMEVLCFIQSVLGRSQVGVVVAAASAPAGPAALPAITLPLPLLSALLLPARRRCSSRRLVRLVDAFEADGQTCRLSRMPGRIPALSETSSSRRLEAGLDQRLLITPMISQGRTGYWAYHLCGPQRRRMRKKSHARMLEGRAGFSEVVLRAMELAVAHGIKTVGRRVRGSNRGV